jgi:TPR repeat protein
MMTDAAAQVRLGYKFLKQKRWGMAYDWFSKAAAQGSSEAALEVGRLHDLGLHETNEGGKGTGGGAGGGGGGDISDLATGGGSGGRDLVGAVHWYDQAARGGEARAMFRLALWYRDGEGVAKDHSVSDQWMRLAGDRGMPSAQFHLAAKLFKQAEVRAGWGQKI